MNLLKLILGDGLAKPIEAVGSAIDRLVTSDEERLKLRNELAQIQDAAKARVDSLALDYEKEVTARLKIDMASDSWLSKSVRPIVMLWLVGVFTIISTADGNIGWFKVNPEYVSIYAEMLKVAFGFYFTARGAEKIAKVIKGK